MPACSRARHREFLLESEGVREHVLAWDGNRHAGDRPIGLSLNRYGIAVGENVAYVQLDSPIRPVVENLAAIAEPEIGIVPGVAPIRLGDIWDDDGNVWVIEIRIADGRLVRPAIGRSNIESSQATFIEGIVAYESEIPLGLFRGRRTVKGLSEIESARLSSVGQTRPE